MPLHDEVSGKDGKEVPDGEVDPVADAVFKAANAYLAALAKRPDWRHNCFACKSPQKEICDKTGKEWEKIAS